MGQYIDDGQQRSVEFALKLAVGQKLSTQRACKLCPFFGRSAKVKVLESLLAEARSRKMNAAEAHLAGLLAAERKRLGRPANSQARITSPKPFTTAPVAPAVQSPQAPKPFTRPTVAGVSAPRPFPGLVHAEKLPPSSAAFSRQRAPQKLELPEEERYELYQKALTSPPEIHGVPRLPDSSLQVFRQMVEMLVDGKNSGAITRFFRKEGVKKKEVSTLFAHAKKRVAWVGREIALRKKP